MDRNAYFTSRPMPIVPIPGATAAQTLARQPSSPNLTTTSSNTVSVGPTHRPSASTGGTSYTVSQFPMSTSDLAGAEEVFGTAQYLNQRPPTFYNLSPNIITSTVRRGPEGKL